MDDNTIESIAKGATKGLLSWTKEEVKLFLKRLSNKQLAFINKEETIDLVKEQRKTSEWELYSKFIKDKRLRTLIQLGLGLRKLEQKDSKKQRLLELRDKIREAYSSSGLHIALLVQNDILGKFLAIMLPHSSSTADLSNYFEEILNNVDKYAVFIEERDNPKRKIEELKTRILANLPRAMIISGYMSMKPKVKKIKEGLERKIEGYSTEVYQDKKRFMFFLVKEESTTISN